MSMSCSANFYLISAGVLGQLDSIDFVEKTPPGSRSCPMDIPGFVLKPVARIGWASPSWAGTPHPSAPQIRQAAMTPKVRAAIEASTEPAPLGQPACAQLQPDARPSGALPEAPDGRKDHCRPEVRLLGEDAYLSALGQTVGQRLPRRVPKRSAGLGGLSSKPRRPAERRRGNPEAP